jgi:hypothetical protein
MGVIMGWTDELFRNLVRLNNTVHSYYYQENSFYGGIFGQVMFNYSDSIFFFVVGDFGGSYTVIYIMLQYCPEFSFNWIPKFCWTHATNNYKYIQHRKKFVLTRGSFIYIEYVYTSFEVNTKLLNKFQLYYSKCSANYMFLDAINE